MKKKLNKIFCIILMLLVCCSFSLVSLAASPVTVSLEVETKLSGEDIPTGESYEFVLTSLDTGDEITTVVDGEGVAKFDRLSFDNVGEYKFTVRQTQGINSDCIYDSTIYYVTITVYYSESGYDFDISAAVYKDGVGEKQDAIIFENVYKAVATQTTQKETTTAHEKETEVSKVHTTVEATTKIVSDNPNTGDNSGIQKWVIVFAVGFVFLLGAVVVLVPKKKYHDDIF